jgi:hypothetical protein
MRSRRRPYCTDGMQIPGWARQQNLLGGKGLYFNQLSEEVSVDACRKANHIINR